LRQVCWNCPTYGWADKYKTNPTNAKTPLVCNDCKFALYCSRECQLEHWKKVHKKHCKYLSGKEKSPISRHGEDCHICRREADKCIPTYKVHNPEYPCHVKWSYQGDHIAVMLKRVNYYVSTGELTGQFISKHDKNIAILQQIWVKIRAVYPKLFDGNKLYANIAIYLSQLRIMVSFESFTSYSEDENDKNTAVEMFSMSKELLIPLLYHVNKFHQSMRKYKKTEKGDYKWWTSFIFFLNLFFQANFFYRIMFDLQCISAKIFEMSEETIALRDSACGSNFPDIWTKLLDLAINKMVPFQELLETYCDGNLNRKCGVCSRKTRVTTFHPFYITTELIENPKNDKLVKELAVLASTFAVGRSYVEFGTKPNICCGLSSCNDKTAWTIVQTKFVAVSAGQSFVKRFEMNRCDCCFIVTESVHRCSGCKKKLYCSEKCQHKDWKVHKLCCADLSKSSTQQETKKKTNTSARDEVGIKKMNDFTQLWEDKGVNFKLIDKLNKIMEDKGNEEGFKEIDKFVEENSSSLSEEDKNIVMKYYSSDNMVQIVHNYA